MVWGGSPHLGSSLQQQPGAVRVSLRAGLVERGDVVHRHRVDRGSALDEPLQLQGSAVGRRLVQGSAVSPETFHTQKQIQRSGYKTSFVQMFWFNLGTISNSEKICRVMCFYAFRNNTAENYNGQM